MTQEIAAKIQAAILKVGSKDKLKPIKEELPEEVKFFIWRFAFLKSKSKVNSDFGIK